MPATCFQLSALLCGKTQMEEADVRATGHLIGSSAYIPHRQMTAFIVVVPTLDIATVGERMPVLSAIAAGTDRVTARSYCAHAHGRGNKVTVKTGQRISSSISRLMNRVTVVLPHKNKFGESYRRAYEEKRMAVTSGQSTAYGPRSTAVGCQLPGRESPVGLK